MRYSCRAMVWCSHFQVWCSALMRYRIPTQSRVHLMGIPFSWPDARRKRFPPVASVTEEGQGTMARRGFCSGCCCLG
uniref:Putative secreted protein n=1 Tax=Anopheles triannulatus TaxID=58253 RepID=A0A2M4B0Q9_9DIPT